MVAILSLILSYHRFPKHVVSIVHGTIVLCIYIVFGTPKVVFWASGPVRISRFRVWKRHDKAAILSLIFSYHKFTKHVVSIVRGTNVWMTS